MNLESIKQRLHTRFDLHNDQADLPEIDGIFRSGVEFRGTNLWVLIFAILLASIGLNVNSTAVIVGAMLISPLMGPIMALGYGAGINDSALMKSSFFNLGLAVFLSLLASTAYFLISPLSQAHSELLARTTPTIWDVLIALFGGLAGVIGVTRRVKSNVLSGVAIATALMPPLCTAGYGLAVGNWPYFFGAIYLFTINSVFIAIATWGMVRQMQIPSVTLLAGHSILKRRTVVGFLIFCTVVPSSFLAIDLVQKEVFESNSASFIRAVFRIKPQVLVIVQQTDHRKKQISVTLAGERLSDEEISIIKSKMSEFGLKDADLAISQSGQVMPDMNAIKKDLINEFLKVKRPEVDERDASILALQAELGNLRKMDQKPLLLQAIHQELQAQFPNAIEITVTTGLSSTADLGRSVLLVQIQLPKPINAAEKERLRRGLRVRAGLEFLEDVRLDVWVPPRAKSSQKNSR